jgi:hypothetical protein
VEAAQVTWRPLGELFVARGLITEAELDVALEEQAATGKRLGEILVERGLVSGPDLTSVLMDQLGVEVAKEEGFGSGLWAEIKRRHKRVRQGEDEPDEEGIDVQPDITLVAAYVESDHEPEPEPELEVEPEAEHAPEAEAEHAFEAEHEPEPELAEPEPVVADEELDGIWAEYEAPAPVETFELEPAAELDPELAPEPEVPELEEAELDEIRAEYAPLALELVTDPWSTPEPEPVGAESGEAAALRAELEDAREDIARLHGMLADAMAALAALSAETGGDAYAR